MKYALLHEVARLKIRACTLKGGRKIFSFSNSSLIKKDCNTKVLQNADDTNEDSDLSLMVAYSLKG